MRFPNDGGSKRFNFPGSISSSGADHLEQATRSFIEDYLSKLESMEDSAFSQHKEGLINNLLQKDKNLTQRSRRYWSDLKKENLDFNTRELLAAEIDNLNISEIKTYLEEVATNLMTRGCWFIAAVNLIQCQARGEDLAIARFSSNPRANVSSVGW